MKSQLWILLIPAVLLVGCVKSSTKPPTGSLVTEFRLTDAAGNTTETFSLGEDIFFEFTITNETGEEQEWVSEHNLPATYFTIHAGDLMLGASYDRFPLGSTSLQGVLPPDDEMITIAGWLDHSRHAPLAVGTYKAFAILNYEFDDLKPFKQWELDFEIVPPREHTTEIFALYRMPTYSFSFSPIALYYLSIIEFDGKYVLSGTVAQDGSMLTMACPPPTWTDPCFHQLQFDDVYLSSAEVEQLEAILDSFPEEEHLIDPVCDPNLISRYHLNGRIEEINPCASGSEQYWQAVEDIENFLAGFVPEF